jgi:hypothetical protein
MKIRDFRFGQLNFLPEVVTTLPVLVLPTSCYVICDFCIAIVLVNDRCLPVPNGTCPNAIRSGGVQWLMVNGK